MTHLVSCIVPVYNGEDYLSQTLDSILAQTYEPLQVIVVDDGSTDGTPAVAERYGARVQYVRQANAGQAAALNRGLELARGEWAAFLDADDLWEPHKTMQQLELLRAQPELGGAVTMVQNVWLDDVRDEEARLQDHRHARPLQGYYFSALLVSRRALAQVGSFDPTLRHAAAADWFLRASLSGVQVGLVPEVLVWRRLHKDSLSHAGAEASRAEHLRVFKAYQDKKRARAAG